MRKFQRNPVFQNAFWIVACKVAQSCLNLIVGMMTARYLGPSNYGLISYAVSVTAFFLPIMQLGLRSTLVQEIINDPQKEGQILGTTFIMTVSSALLSFAGLVAFAMIANKGEHVTVIVCALYGISLFPQALELIQYWFQAKLLSKYASVVSLIAYAVVSLYKISLLASGKNVYWFAIAQSIDSLLIALILIWIFRRKSGQKLSFSANRGRQMFHVSKYYIVSGMMVTVFAHTDSIMLKLMINESATGFYTAAVSCAAITSFIFGAIIDSARPAVLESKKIGSIEFEKNMKRLICVVIYLSLLQCVLITVCAAPIVKILYGDAYHPAVAPLRLIVWYTTFSYLGAVRNIWILAEGQQHYLWIINLLGALLNVLMNAVLIPFMGCMGAALASVATQFFTNVIVGFFIQPIRPFNTLLLEGAKPGCVIEILRQLRRG